MKENSDPVKKSVQLYWAKRNHIIPSPTKISWGNRFVNTSSCTFRPGRLASQIIALYRNEFNFCDSGSKTFILEKKLDLPTEAYNIDIADSNIKVYAGGLRGFFYALTTLRQIREGDLLPEVEIEDTPHLAMRGFHVSFEKLRQLHAGEVRMLLPMLAKFKLNTVILEYADKFPFSKNPDITSGAGFSIEDVREFEKIAAENFLQVIPLCQSLGHMGYVTQHAKYRNLLEASLTKIDQEQLCPSNPGSLELFKELAAELMQAHPNGKYFHIGADEAKSLGVCQSCAEAARTHGKSRIFVNHINKVCQWIKSQGRTPIIWDDMISSYPEILSDLDRDIIIMCWDYWTTSLSSPIIVARASGKGVVHDRRWENDWNSELSDIEREIINKFSCGINMETDLSKRYLRHFKDYLGPGFPKRLEGFYNVRFFQDHGFKVIGAPTTLGNCIDETFGLPNYNRFLGNIRAFSEKCGVAGTLGMVTTSWYNFPPEILNLGIMATGQYAWSRKYMGNR